METHYTIDWFVRGPFFFSSFSFFSISLFDMRLSQVRAFPLALRRGNFPFEPPRMAQEGQVNGPLHWKSCRQVKPSWMLVVLIVHCLVVHSLPVHAGRGRHRFLGEKEGGFT